MLTSGVSISEPTSAETKNKVAFRYVYFIVFGLLFAALWIRRADTEGRLPPWVSVVTITRGPGYAPFMRRRLVFDLADVITRVVPKSVWQSVDRGFYESSLGRRIVIAKPVCTWPRNEFPLLMTVSLLIGASYCGFIYCCACLFDMFYRGPAWFRDLSAVALGYFALGSMSGDWFGTPYDIPQLFLFTSCCIAIFARSLWFFPLFVAASYSKETSILLIPIYWLCSSNRFSPVTLLKCFALAVVFFPIHWYINKTFPGMFYDFVSYERNLRQLLFWAVYDSWSFVALLFTVVLCARDWHRFPKQLKYWMLFVPILLCSAFYKGWIDERRALLEFYPPFAFFLLQVITKALGFESLMQTKPCDDGLDRV